MDDVLACMKNQRMAPSFKNINGTTEADFERNLIFSPIQCPDPYVIEAGAKKDKLTQEFLESGPGFSFIRLFLHQKVEGFNFGPIKKTSKDFDIFNSPNIAEYCPKSPLEFLPDQQPQTTTIQVQLPKSPELTPAIIEEFVKLIKKHGIANEAFGPKFEQGIRVEEALDTLLK
jgi:hypothetical protein